MITNTNTSTGIPFGVIALNSLQDWLFEEIMQLPNASLDASLADYARNVLAENGMDPEDVNALDDTAARDEAEEADPLYAERFFDGCDMEFDGAEGVIDGVTVCVSEMGGAYILFIMESPNVGRYSPCSPCVPGAGDLDSPDREHGIECYDVPAEWRACNDD